MQSVPRAPPNDYPPVLPNKDKNHGPLPSGVPVHEGSAHFPPPSGPVAPSHSDQSGPRSAQRESAPSQSGGSPRSDSGPSQSSAPPPSAAPSRGASQGGAAPSSHGSASPHGAPAPKGGHD